MHPLAKADNKDETNICLYAQDKAFSRLSKIIEYWDPAQLFGFPGSNDPCLPIYFWDPELPSSGIKWIKWYFKQYVWHTILKWSSVSSHLLERDWNLEFKITFFKSTNFSIIKIWINNDHIIVKISFYSGSFLYNHLINFTNVANSHLTLPEQTNQGGHDGCNKGSVS